MARNIDNMTAQNWKSLDTSSIDKVQSSSNKNKQLINDIKAIVSSAVNSLYGNAQTDDKYIKIVDLIMLRISGVLQDLTFDDSDILENIKTTIQTKLDEYYTDNTSTDKTNKTDSKTQIQDLTDSIIDNLDKNKKDEEKTNDKNKDNTQTKIKTNTSSCTQKIIETLNDNIKKLEKTVQSGLNIFKNPKLLNSSQFRTFNKILTQNFKNLTIYLKDIYGQINKGINDVIELQKKTIEQIEAAAKSGKGAFIKFLLIALVALGIVFYVFKDKITKWIKEKLGIDQKDTILEGLKKKAYAWIQKKIVEGIAHIEAKFVEWINELKAKVVAEWKKFTEDPIKYVIDHLKGFLKSILEFANSIWSWITGSKSETLEKWEKGLDDLQKASEEDTDNKIKASEKIEAKMFGEIKDGFDKAQNTQLNSFTDTTNQAINTANNATNTVNKTVDKAVTTTTEQANQISKNAEQAGNAITQQTNEDLNKLQENVNGNISDSTKKLNDNAQSIVDEIARDGAQKPAQVDKLTSYASSSSGGEITVNTSTLPNGVSNVKSPADNKVAFTTTEKAKEANSKLNDINNTTNNLNVSANSNNKVNVVQQSVNITQPDQFPSNIKLKNDTIKEYSELLEKLKEAKTNIDSNESLLKDIKSDVNSYFRKLNSTTDELKDTIARQKKQQDSNTVIINNGERKQDVAKEDQ